MLEVVGRPGGSLADLLEASVWRTTARPAPAARAAAEAVATFLAAEEVLVERMTKKGLRTFDCRAAVVSLGVVRRRRPGDVECAILEVVLRHGTPSVRPDDVLAGLRASPGSRRQPLLCTSGSPRARWMQQTGTVGDPLALNRDTA